MDGEQHYRCLKEGSIGDMKSDIRILNKAVELNEKKIENLSGKCDIMNDLSTTMSVMSLSLEHIVEHNNMQDRRQEKQDEVVAKQNETLVNINQNLSELNKGQASLDHKIENLEERVDASEQRNTINIMDLQKEKYLNYLRKYVVPGATGAAIMAALLEILKIIKS